MNAPVYLKPWLNDWSRGARIALTLILISSITQFVSFALSQNYVVAYFGAQPEDITFSLQICYAGIVTFLPLQARFLRYFEMKGYLICIITFGMFLSVACMYTTDIHLFFIIRFLQGVVICSVSASVLTLIPAFLKMEIRQVVGPSIFYGTLLSSGALIGIVASQVSLNSDFKNIYNYMVFFQIISLIIVLFGFKAKSGIRPYPLYQIDWQGATFFACAASGFAFTMVYGSKYYWFTDTRIVFSCTLTICGALLFLYRCATVKRPIIDLAVFKYTNFWIGLVLLAMYYGMKESINLIFGYTGSTLQWGTGQIVSLALVNVGGLISFMIVSTLILLRKKNATQGFVFAGFCMLLIYHVWMYFIFTPDLSFEDLLLPLFFQGAASAILFVPIMIFILKSVPPSTGITGLAVAAYTRFASLLNAGAGFYNLQLYYNQLFRESLLGHLTIADNEAGEHLQSLKELFVSKGYAPDQALTLANISLAKTLGVQSQLLTNRATFLFIAVLICIILGIAVLTALYQARFRNAQVTNQ
nr:hypothetical protein [Mucilaginibacter sp. L294]